MRPRATPEPATTGQAAEEHTERSIWFREEADPDRDLRFIIDEFRAGFEIVASITLIQTHKIEHFPVVLFGSRHWKPLRDWSERMADDGLISREDLDLVAVTDDPQEAVRTVLACYRRECSHAVRA